VSDTHPRCGVDERANRVDTRELWRPQEKERVDAIERTTPRLGSLEIEADPLVGGPVPGW